ncbi:hypothetical protein JZ751_027264 [Albula glossodonta]|uniref:Uncharacterized protein n=1 Tax=Albula glossodonta TaxID=121402 RepID=A0A8T2N0J1_9TELE|nr:hypothetical protein JZ751_027264 [Albula glossodonta]
MFLKGGGGGRDTLQHHHGDTNRKAAACIWKRLNLVISSASPLRRGAMEPEQSSRTHTCCSSTVPNTRRLPGNPPGRLLQGADHSEHNLGHSEHSPGHSEHSPGHSEHSLGHSAHSLGHSAHSLGHSEHSLGHSLHSPGHSEHSPGHSEHSPGHSEHSLGHSEQHRPTGRVYGAQAYGAGLWSTGLRGGFMGTCLCEAVETAPTGMGQRVAGRGRAAQWRLRAPKQAHVQSQHVSTTALQHIPQHCTLSGNTAAPPTECLAVVKAGHALARTWFTVELTVLRRIGTNSCRALALARERKESCSEKRDRKERWRGKREIEEGETERGRTSEPVALQPLCGGGWQEARRLEAERGVFIGCTGRRTGQTQAVHLSPNLWGESAPMSRGWLALPHSTYKKTKSENEQTVQLISDDGLKMQGTRCIPGVQDEEERVQLPAQQHPSQGLQEITPTSRRKLLDPGTQRPHPGGQRSTAYMTVEVPWERRWVKDSPDPKVACLVALGDQQPIVRMAVRTEFPGWLVWLLHAEIILLPADWHISGKGPFPLWRDTVGNKDHDSSALFPERLCGSWLRGVMCASTAQACGMRQLSAPGLEHRSGCWVNLLD